ncbi:MAG: MarR family transcriptional regulator [Clostridia bacterium]|nr:MarR family transcriptional regulator [Clostridia bacterium]
MNKTNTDLTKIFELSHTYRDVFIRNFEIAYPAPEGLNKTHLRTLMYIRFANNPKMSEISGNMGLEKGSFTPVAQKLLDLGYIRKDKTEKDKRKSILNLTEKGKRLTDEFGKAHEKYIKEKLDLLTPDEVKYLFSSMDTVLHIVKKLI